jgi:hypothetical protein
MVTSEKDRSNSLALFISTEVCKNASSHVREGKNNYNAEMQKPGENNAKKKNNANASPPQNTAKSKRIKPRDY